MKKLILLMGILSIFFIKVPQYNELNNLAIIEDIAIFKKNNNYSIYLKEVIPKKSDDGISYSYKIYKGSGQNTTKAINNIFKKTKKKFYLKRVKLLVTNMNTSKELLHDLDIKPKSIMHSNYLLNFRG